VYLSNVNVFVSPNGKIIGKYHIAGYDIVKKLCFHENLSSLLTNIIKIK